LSETKMAEDLLKIPPRSSRASLFLNRNWVVDIGNRDKLGGPEQVGKVITVDDIAFGYDVLYQERTLFRKQRWKGMEMQQDPLDAFAIQDFLWAEQPDTMLEFGTWTGGSAVFFADIMTSYNPHAHVITVDPERHYNNDRNKFKATSSPYWGSTIRPITGYPNHNKTRAKVMALLDEFNSSNIFLNEDSNHFAEVVFANLVAYQHLVRPCGWILIQDTKISRLEGTPGPIAAQRAFRRKFPAYQVRRQYEYFVYTQHAQGWLQKVPHGRHCEAK